MMNNTHNNPKAMQDITFNQIRDLTLKQLMSFDVQFSDKRTSEVNA